MQRATRQILIAALLCGFAMVAQAGSLMVAPTTTVTQRDALADAQMIASFYSEARVMKISGVSMLPFFGEGALVVVKPIEEQRLRQGMVVVYTNRFGEMVAHRLVSQQEGGWVAQGFNNEQVDSTPVNASNLIGVVYATFHTSGPDAGATFAAHGNIAVETALAAPAK